MFYTTNRILQKAINLNAEIYHIHDPELIPAGIRLLKKSKLVIFDSHENIPEQLLSKPYLNKTFSRIISWIYRIFENITLKKFSALIAATPHIYEALSRKNNKVVTINNYPIINELAMLSENFHPINNQVCFIGNISEIRGIKVLMDAMRLTKNNARLVLAGFFSDNNLKSELKNTESWKYVLDLGFLSRKELGQVLAQSIAGIVTFLHVPNHINAQPNKMFEYMSAGLPVIASDFPLWKKIIEDHYCGICVNPSKPDEIAHAIDYLIDNPEIAKVMGQNGKRAVYDKFNWKIEEKKLIDLYKSLQINS